MSALVKVRSSVISRFWNRLSIVEQVRGSVLSRIDMWGQSQMIPHQTGTVSWKHHRTDFSGSTARMLLARSPGVFPAVRFRAPVNVPVALIFLAKFMGTRGSQSPLMTPLRRSDVAYL